MPAKPKKIQSILSYLQKDVPNSAPIPDPNEEGGEPTPPDEDLEVIEAVPMATKKKKRPANLA